MLSLKFLGTYTCVSVNGKDKAYIHLSFYHDATLSNFSMVIEARTFVAVLCGFFF